MSVHNRKRRKPGVERQRRRAGHILLRALQTNPGRHIGPADLLAADLAEQRETAVERAKEKAKRYPTPPTYRTHVGTYTGPKEMKGPVLKPIAALPAVRWNPAAGAFRLIAALLGR